MHACCSCTVLVTERGSLSSEEIQLRDSFEEDIVSRGVKLEEVQLEDKGFRVVVVSAEFRVVAEIAESIKLCLPTTVDNYKLVGDLSI